MIDIPKVRMMTRLSLYEKGTGKKELKMHRYSMRGYLSMKLLGSFFAVTVAYILGALLYMTRYYSVIMTEGLAFSYRGILKEILIVYAIVMVINLIITFVIQKKRYQKMMKNVKKYDKELFVLKKYLDKQEQSQ